MPQFAQLQSWQVSILWEDFVACICRSADHNTIQFILVHVQMAKICLVLLAIQTLVLVKSNKVLDVIDVNHDLTSTTSRYE